MDLQESGSGWADRGLFVTELLLSTLLLDHNAPAAPQHAGPLAGLADFGAMGCMDVMTLEVALENLNLREATASAMKKQPPPPPPR